MQRSLSRWFIGLCAALLLLAPIAALAGTGADACNLLTSGNCKFVTTPATCSGQCTPPSLVAQCDAQCDVSPTVSCTTSCEPSCMATCTANPGSFSCTQTCFSGCQASCTTACNGQSSGCASDCMLDCPNRCGIQCDAVPPQADCTVACQANCNASCQVQANVACHANCTATVEPPVCKLDCTAPTGAVFCGSPPQYINLATAASDCLSYLETQGVSTTTTCTLGKGCTTSGGCSAAPALGAGAHHWGALGVTAMMIGVGLLVARRRRRRS